jgi:hypothetical protein
MRERPRAPDPFLEKHMEVLGNKGSSQEITLTLRSSEAPGASGIVDGVQGSLIITGSES